MARLLAPSITIAQKSLCGARASHINPVTRRGLTLELGGEGTSLLALQRAALTLPQKATIKSVIVTFRAAAVSIG